PARLFALVRAGLATQAAWSECAESDLGPSGMVPSRPASQSRQRLFRLSGFPRRAATWRVWGQTGRPGAAVRDTATTRWPQAGFWPRGADRWRGVYAASTRHGGRSMKIELRPLDQVKPYEKNPRVNDAAVEAVAESIRQFGFRQPVVVDGDGVIV